MVKRGKMSEVDGAVNEEARLNFGTGRRRFDFPKIAVHRLKHEKWKITQNRNRKLKFIEQGINQSDE